MSRIWLFRIGRLAVGNPRAFRRYNFIRTEQNVWTRVLWIFWWCSPLQLGPPIPHAVEDDPTVKTEPMVLHWIDPAEGEPACGALKDGAAWTIEWAYVSCKACREKGLPRKVQYDFSTR